MERQDVIAQTQEAYAAFADLLDDLSSEEWDQPTCCDGWAVRDVAGHVVAVMEDVVAGKVGSRTPAQEAADLRGEQPAELARRLREAMVGTSALLDVLDEDAWNGPSPAPDEIHDGTLGNAVLVLGNDAIVHADDIRRAAGREPAAVADLALTLAFLEESLTDRGWGPARIVIDGSRPLQIGTGGPSIDVDALAFVRAATGRQDPEPLGLDTKVNVFA